MKTTIAGTHTIALANTVLRKDTYERSIPPSERQPYQKERLS